MTNMTGGFGAVNEPPTDRLDRIRRDYGRPGSWALMSEADIAWLMGQVVSLRGLLYELDREARILEGRET